MNLNVVISEIKNQFDLSYENFSEAGLYTNGLKSRSRFLTVRALSSSAQALASRVQLAKGLKVEKEKNCRNRV